MVRRGLGLGLGLGLTLTLTPAPTLTLTLSLTLTLTRYGEDGRERVLNEPGAVGTRVARSYLRFGQMELFTQRGELPLLQAR